MKESQKSKTFCAEVICCLQTAPTVLPPSRHWSTSTTSLWKYKAQVTIGITELLTPSSEHYIDHESRENREFSCAPLSPLGFARSHSCGHLRLFDYCTGSGRLRLPC